MKLSTKYRHELESILSHLERAEAYFYNRTPTYCWGSKSNMDKWMKKKKEED